VAPSEVVLKEQIDGAKQEVAADLAELRSQLAGLQRKVALGLAVLVSALIILKVGRRILRHTRD
jgi:hypothetical protein